MGGNSSEKIRGVLRWEMEPLKGSYSVWDPKTPGMEEGGARQKDTACDAQSWGECWLLGVTGEGTPKPEASVRESWSLCFSYR